MAITWSNRRLSTTAERTGSDTDGALFGFIVSESGGLGTKER